MPGDKGSSAMNDGSSMKRMTTPERLARLESWSLRKPVIALMGEFSSGKSTLLNLLLGQNILPMQVTATRLPPIWLRYGDEAPYRVDLDGQKHPVDWSDTSTVPLDDTRYIRLFCKAEILKRCDLIDTPGISDPSIPVRYWIRTVGYANAVLWCTHAAQAWRESERGAWIDLPQRLREVSLLLVTRKDKLKSAEDLGKVDRRLRRETADLFNAHLFLSLTHALAASQSGNVAAWEASGARDFAEKLDILVDGVTLQRSYMLERYEIGTTAPAVATQTTPPIDEERYFVLRNAISVPEPAEPGRSMRLSGRGEARTRLLAIPGQQAAAPMDVGSRL
jgi:hypothetical protein